MDERGIFDAALDIADPVERAAFLDKSCGRDTELRRQLDELLAAQDKLGHFLNRPVGRFLAMVDDDFVVERPGHQIGPYRLKEQIGEGGFGLVFVADQQEPVQRQVALKVIKPGMDTREVLARFAVERQALAIMDHPNIAKVLDAGTTESGRPYFVMELVHGEPITDYCNQNHFTPRQRLELFVSVCQAVQHAHQKGIIHRDIKPSNVLVSAHDGQSLVKIIDFGVAKAINRHLAERTFHTAVDQMVGTPLYMSPEQASLTAMDIDTRSDIYSLGVLLYELLTGTTPFDKEHFANAAYDEIRRIIREDEPEKPSTRLHHSDSLPVIAIQQKTEPAQLSKEIRGDLDWITMKALEKDRGRRYETADGLARDIERYLADEPVEACPPSIEYRFRKFVRRNKGPVVAAGLLALLLVGGIAGTSWGLIQAELARRNEARERMRAEANEKSAQDDRRTAVQQTELARAVTNFLRQDLLELASIEGQYENKAADMGKDARVRDLLDRAAKRVEGRFTDQPLAEAEIRWAIGATYRKLGEPRLAIPQLEKSASIYEKQLGVVNETTLLAQNSLAVAFLANDQLEEAARILEHVCNTRTKHYDPNHRHALTAFDNLAVVYQKSDRLNDAIPLFERVRDAQLTNLGPDDPNTLLTLNNLALAYEDAERLPEAIRLLEHVRERRTVVLGVNHPMTLATLSNLGSAYRKAGRLPDAIKHLEQARDAQRAVLGAENPDTLLTMSKLARAYSDAKRHMDAIQLFEQVRDIEVKKYGRDHAETLSTMNNLALAYKRVNRLADAIQLYERVREIEKNVYRAGHPKTFTTLNNLARAYLAADRPTEAVKTAEQVRDAAIAHFDANHPMVLNATNTLALCYSEAGKLNEALQQFKRVFEGRLVKLGPDHDQTLESLAKIAATYKSLDRLSESIQSYEKLRDLRLAKHGLKHEATLITLTNLALAYRAAGRLPDAVRTYEQTRDGRLSLNGPEHEDTLVEIRNLGAAYFAAGQMSEAEALFRELLSTRERVTPTHWRTFETMSLFGGTLLAQKKLESAEPMLLNGMRGLKVNQQQIPVDRRANVISLAIGRLINFYKAANKIDEVTKWRQELNKLRTANSNTEPADPSRF